jgi:hypothetical protein
MIGTVAIGQSGRIIMWLGSMLSGDGTGPNFWKCGEMLGAMRVKGSEMSQTAGQLRKAIDFYHQELQPYFRNRPKKPLLRQIGEVSRLYREYRYIPYQYFKSGAYLRSWSEVDVTDYIPPKLIKNLQHKLNPREHREIARNKLLFREVLESHGLPTIRELLRTDSEGRILTANGASLSEAEAGALIRSHDADLFYKPVCGTWGRQAGILRRGEAPTAVLRMPDMLLQPLIEQHKVLSALYPHSVNTVRIDTLLTEEGVVNSAAVLKVGAGGAVVDNGSAGGFLVGIDLETGQLDSLARQRPAFCPKDHAAHPDTGAVFAGIRLPFWDLVRETVNRAALAMRPLQSLGWDVAITPVGVCLVEANSVWGVNSLQSGQRGMGRTPVGRLARRLHGLPDLPAQS